MSLDGLRLAILLICAVHGITSAQDPPYVVVRDETGSWLSLVEVSPATEFWLRPQPFVTSPPNPDGCLGKSQLSIELSLWTPQSLARARRALIGLGRCGSADSCRVVPIPVDRIGLRDQQVQWRTEKRWFFVSGVIPAQQRFSLRRTNDRSSDCGLDALVLEMVTENSRSVDTSSALNISAVDVQWAMKLSKIGSYMTSVVAVDGTLLRQLARELLSAKVAKLEEMGGSVPFPIAPSMVKQTEFQLTQRAVRFVDFHKYLRSSVKGLFGSRSPAGNEKVYILKKLSDIRPFPIPLSTLDLTLISVSLPNTKGRQNETSGSGREDVLGDSPLPTTQSDSAVNTELRGRVDALESIVRDLLKKAKQRPTASPTMKTEMKPKVTTEKPLSRTHIDDCSEAKSRRLGAGIFTLRPTGRRVRCTKDGELVALSRQKGNVNFDRDWKDYRDGFGDARTGDYWVGLRYLANYSRAGDRCMRLVMKPWKLTIPDRVGRYAGINIGSEKENFRLSYTQFKGNVVENSFADMNGQPFSTRDRDNDAFVGNCATQFGGGNWYKSCTSANIFGRHRYLDNTTVNNLLPDIKSSEVMCWRGLHQTQGNMCSPLVSILMIFSSAEGEDSRKVVFSQIATADNRRCKSSRKTFTVPATGVYYITAAGGSGGRSTVNAPGGRGALVKAKMVLKLGKKLVLAAGCGGIPGLYQGQGGNATYLIDEEEWKPLLVAGGGGGAANAVPGCHARAVTTGGDAWYTVDPSAAKPVRFLGPSSQYRGLGWSRCRRNSTVCMTGGMVTYRGRVGYTYRTFHSNRRGGGGGGGYEGGVTGVDYLASGGGGGSFCDPQLGKDCRIEAGGNRHQVGFLIMEKKSCF